MKISGKYILIILSILLSESVVAQPELLVKKRLAELIRTEDTLLYYHRSCGAGGVCQIESAYFLYKTRTRYTLEYYKWNNASNKIIEQFRTKRKSDEIRSIFHYATENYDSISKYKNFFFGYTSKHIIVDEIRKSFDTIKNIEKFNDGPWVNYAIKLNKKILFGDHNGRAEISEYIRGAQPIGVLLLILNMLYYKESFDSISSS